RSGRGESQRRLCQPSRRPHERLQLRAAQNLPLMFRIISGGQAGVDRAALDFAIAHGIAYGGWCPKGGWAEDMPDPPGLLRHYPLLRETPSSDPSKRTEWNVRDSDATLVVSPPVVTSPGTDFAIRCAQKYLKPLLIAAPDPESSALVSVWLHDQKNLASLNIAG